MHARKACGAKKPSSAQAVLRCRSNTCASVEPAITIVRKAIARSARANFVDGSSPRFFASSNSAPCNAQIVTALLAGSSNIEDLNPAEHRHLLRKRLDRAGLSNVPCIGGFEIIYRDRAKQWVLHVNLLILGGTTIALERFEAAFSSSELFRPCQIDPLKDLAKQISYLLKFTTYHRPLRQTGAKKSPARPLNAREHVALVNWMARYSFSDMMFLYGVRRKGDRLVRSQRWRG